MQYYIFLFFFSIFLNSLHAMDDHILPESLIVEQSLQKQFQPPTQSDSKETPKKCTNLILTLYPPEIYYSYKCPYCNKMYRSVTRYSLLSNFKNSHLKFHPEKEFNAEHFNNNVQEPECFLFFSVKCLETSCEYFIQSRYNQIKRSLRTHLYAHKSKYTKEQIANYIRTNAI